jgi:hypothetical protein
MSSSVREKCGDQARAPRTERVCRLVEWKPWSQPNSSLLGHATISFSGWIVHRVPIFRTKDGLSAGRPNAPEVDAAGNARLKPDGKKQYWAVITFKSPADNDRWQRLVLGALAAADITAATGSAP